MLWRCSDIGPSGYRLMTKSMCPFASVRSQRSPVLDIGFRWELPSSLVGVYGLITGYQSVSIIISAFHDAAIPSPSQAPCIW